VTALIVIAVVAGLIWGGALLWLIRACDKAPLIERNRRLKP
jgi:hypothetical protein